MKFKWLKRIDRVNKKVLYVASFLIVFFGLQLAIIYFAGYNIRRSLVGDNFSANSAAYASQNWQLQQINQKLLIIQSDLSYLKSNSNKNNIK